MQFASIDGRAFHVELTVAATSNAPALVFANSLGTDFRIWDDLLSLLAGRFTTLRYDKRGHGLSDTGQAPYTMDDHIADLAALMDHFGLKRSVVVGLSVGGMIAQGLALSRPDLVAALVLSNTGHKIGDAASWDERISTVRERGIEAMADAVMERWFTAGFRRADNPAFALYRNMLLRTTKDGYAGTCAAIAGADYTDTVGSISVPTLCIGGDQDGSTPPTLVNELASKIGGARAVIIDDAGHLPNIEQPRAYAEALEEFLFSMAASDEPDRNRLA